MKKRLRVSILLVAITAGGLGAYYFFSNTPVSGTSVSKQPRFTVEQQLGGWRVWIKTSPCSGRFDWLAVARDTQPPEGGGRSTYVPYETIVAAPPGIKPCKDPNPMTGCTFAEATTLMEALRPSDAFVDFCCRDYSVWEDTRSTEIDNMSVFLIRSGTPGLGWEIVQGELCCEEAEKMAKKPGVCSQPGNKTGHSGFGPINENAGLNGKALTFYAGTTADKCQADCDQNPSCKGFSLIRAGAYGSNGATCYLMSEATSFAPSPCCISAMKSGGPTPKGIEGTTSDGVDLSGSWERTQDSVTLRINLRSAGKGHWTGNVAISNLGPAPAPDDNSLGAGFYRIFKAMDGAPVTIVSTGPGQLRSTIVINGKPSQSTGTYSKDQLVIGKDVLYRK